jgi:endonuclease/exonuclease/phosphatase family metal-dependent hydrolase
MRKTRLFSLLLVCLAFTGRVKAAPLKVMTYNIKAARHQLPAEQGLELIAQVIEADKPDILLLQEVMRFDPYVDYIDEFQWLMDRLEYPDGRFASAQQDPVPPGTAEWGNAIYLGEGSIISSQKYRLGSGRVLLRVTASIRGRTVHIFCTHLGGDEIPYQAELVAGTISYYVGLAEPVVLGGDFNASAGSDALAPLWEDLQEVFTLLSMSVSTVDMFFVSPDVLVFDAEKVYDPTEASDHDPVICVVNPGSHPDLDRDGDVDLSDYSTFLYCYNGPAKPYAAPGCYVSDFDSDEDVDLADYGIFLGCYNGPSQPATCY